MVICALQGLLKAAIIGTWIAPAYEEMVMNCVGRRMMAPLANLRHDRGC